MQYNSSMKIILTALNAKFIHSCLAIRYLKAYCQEIYSDIELAEFAINDQTNRIIGNLVKREPEVLGFSCYIWNIAETVKVAQTVKQVLPECRIVFGGPEVSFDGAALMEENPWLDFVIIGEGEVPFKQLLDCLADKGVLDEVPGLIWRREGKIVANFQASVQLPMDDIPFPYGNGFAGLENKIIYYETSRGCPYRCQYCLSSNTPGVRFLSMERVRRELETFVEAGISQVKLVDRTFNCNPQRAKEIFRTIISMEGTTNFHFEMAGDIIDDEMIEILKRAPWGLFQFEIGVQSTNPGTLQAIQRKSDLGYLKKGIKKILDMGNIHVHLDLIAGLPKETYADIGASFNDVIELKPHRLQLGFLKLLKGSGLRSTAKKYGYTYTNYPPYEVLSNDTLSYNELWRLKCIEELLEIYYNSHRFDFSLDLLFNSYDGGAFAFFEDFMEYWVDMGHDAVLHNNMELYEILMAYGSRHSNINALLLKELLLLDYFTHEKPKRIPQGLAWRDPVDLVGEVRDFLQNVENIRNYLPHVAELPVKQISRYIHVYTFSLDVLNWKNGCTEKPTTLLFDYSGNIKGFKNTSITQIK